MTSITEFATRSALRWILGRIRTGTLEVRWSDDTEELFGDPADAGVARIEIRDEASLLSALIDEGALGLGATYIEGAWDTPDLAGFLEVASRNVDIRITSPRGSALTDRARSFWDRRPSFARSHAIGEMGDHYNLGNEFYAAWLDRTMSYSSARFASSDQSLEDAQIAKYDNLCRMLDLQPGDRVLEIGCGWGGFMEHAASRYDVHVTGLTLSDEMATYARKRLAEAGLTDRTEVKLQDFQHERAMYDKVVSIEMIEAVGAEFFETYFAKIGRLLRPDGLALIQAITTPDDRFSESVGRIDFIKRHIFPGGQLPSLDAMSTAWRKQSDLRLLHFEDFGDDYARTLHEWRTRFQARIEDVEALGYPPRFQRMWDFYLASCEGAFAERHCGVAQLLLARPDARRAPLRTSVS